MGRIFFVLYHFRYCQPCRRKALRRPRWVLDLVQLEELADVRAEHVMAGGR